MKRLATLACVWLLIGQIALFSQEWSKEASNRWEGTSTYTFTSETPGQLIMEHVRGNVALVGEPVNQVEIVEIITIRSKSEDRARSLFEEAKASVQQVSSESEPLVVRVHGSSLRTRDVKYTYSVKLPTVFSALVQTRGGDIDTQHIKGEIDVKTAGGDIELLDLTGRISATTSGGDVEGVDLGGRVILNTSGGDIDVEGIRGELVANTAGGDIQVEDVEGSVSVKTSGGDIDLQDIEGRDISARTSGGDITVANVTGALDVSTSGGDIELETITGNLDASTSGGNIDINDVRGDIEVSTSGGYISGSKVMGAIDGRTSAGDIVISKVWDRDLENHDVNLRTSAGDIDLGLPRDFPATFQVQVSSPEGHPGETIISDFPLVITATRTIAKATGTAGTGQYDVKLESSVGGITIRWED